MVIFNVILTLCLCESEVFSDSCKFFCPQILVGLENLYH